MYKSKEKTKWDGALFLTGPYVDQIALSRSKRKDKGFTGAPFSGANPIKKGNIAMPGVLLNNETVFSIPGKYDTGPKYNLLFPPQKRKNAFGSRDCPRRDEFMNMLREQQYKAELSKEYKMEMTRNTKNADLDRQIEALRARIREIDVETPGLSMERAENDYVGNVTTNLYNIGRTQEGTTEGLFKDSRDRFYTAKQCAVRRKPRHVQKFAVSSGRLGQSILGRESEKILTAELKVPGQPSKALVNKSDFTGSVDDMFGQND